MVEQIMERIITYKLGEKCALTLKKISGKISSNELRENFGLDEEEVRLVSDFYDLVQEVEE